MVIEAAHELLAPDERFRPSTCLRERWQRGRGQLLGPFPIWVPPPTLEKTRLVWAASPPPARLPHMGRLSAQDTGTQTPGRSGVAAFAACSADSRDALYTQGTHGRHTQDTRDPRGRAGLGCTSIYRGLERGLQISPPAGSQLFACLWLGASSQGILALPSPQNQNPGKEQISR